VWRLTLLDIPVRSAHEMERGQRGVARQISSRLCACLTVEKPGALCAVTEENLALAPRHRAVSPCMIMQSRIRRAQHEATRRGRIFPMEEDHQAQATLKRLVPHHGGRQMPLRVFWPRAAVLETVQGLAGDLPILLTPCPTSLRVRTGGEKHAVSVAPPWGEGMPREADAFLTLFLLRIVAVSTGLGDTRRQAMPRLAQWLRVEGDPGFFRLSLCGCLARRRLALARVPAPRRVTSTTARVAISRPRAARLAQPWKQCPRPHVGVSRLERQDASCAASRAACGLNAVMSTRGGKAGQAQDARHCRAMVRAA
jgi:hypothetical protein